MLTSELNVVLQSHQEDLRRAAHQRLIAELDAASAEARPGLLRRVAGMFTLFDLPSLDSAAQRDLLPEQPRFIEHHT